MSKDNDKDDISNITNPNRISSKHLAQAYGVHHATVLSWVKRGMPHIKGIRGSYFYDSVKVARWLNDNSIAIGKTGRPIDESKRRNIKEQRVIIDNQRKVIKELTEELNAMKIQNIKNQHNNINKESDKQTSD